MNELIHNEPTLGRTAVTHLDDLIKETLVFTAQKGWARSGESFFTALVVFLGEKLGVEYALISELLPDERRARTAGLCAFGQPQPPMEYDLGGTPCENVMGQNLCCYPCGIQALFPQDLLLQDMKAESYLGIPLWDSKGNPIGLIAVIGQHSLENREEAEAILQMVAVRCAHELEQKQAEAQRRRMEVELLRYQKLESIGSLASGVAHDMNNVLGAILGVTSVLRERFVADPSALSNLDLILKATDRGRKLVKGLTDFSRDHLEGAAPLCMNDLLRQEADLLGRTLLQKVALALDLTEPLPLIQGESSALANVVMNLCINAVDAMPQGGTLALRSRFAPEGFVQIMVEDSGHGMPPEVLARARDPYFTTKPLGKGTGLGLALAASAMKAHGGDLQIDSEPGQGTRITLSFPAIPDSSIPIAPPATPAPTPRKALRILMVDDEEFLLESTSAVLGILGHQVTTSTNGREALDHLGQGLQVDVVILDQNMPDRNGTDILIELRTLRPNLPVIISSGFMEPGQERLLAGIPKVSKLPKPYSPAQLQASVLEAVT